MGTVLNKNDSDSLYIDFSGKTFARFNANKTNPCWGFGASPVKIVRMWKGATTAHYLHCSSSCCQTMLSSNGPAWPHRRSWVPEIVTHLESLQAQIFA